MFTHVLSSSPAAIRPELNSLVGQLVDLTSSSPAPLQAIVEVIVLLLSEFLDVMQMATVMALKYT